MAKVFMGGYGADGRQNPFAKMRAGEAGGPVNEPDGADAARGERARPIAAALGRRLRTAPAIAGGRPPPRRGICFAGEAHIRPGADHMMHRGERLTVIDAHEMRVLMHAHECAV